MKKAAWLILLGTLTFVFADCIASYPTFGPPALQNEAYIGGPRPGYFWVGGYWAWGHGQYYWVRGHWERHRLGRTYVPGTWERHGERYRYHKGYWR